MLRQRIPRQQIPNFNQRPSVRVETRFGASSARSKWQLRAKVVGNGLTDKSKCPSNENAHSRRFLCFRRSRLDFLGAAHPRTFLLAGKLNTAPATSIGQRQMVDHSHGSDCRSARFRLLKLGHYLPHARIADSSSTKQSTFHLHAQRNAFRHHDARQQSRSFAPENPRLTEIAQVHGCFSSQSFWKAGSERKGSQIGSSLNSAGVTGSRP